MKNSILFLFCFLSVCNAISISAAYPILQYEYGAINAGTAGTFSTISPDNFVVDHNPAMINFSEPLLFSYSHQPFVIISKFIHNYQSISFRYKHYGFGISKYEFYRDTQTDIYSVKSSSLSISYSISDQSSIGLNVKLILGKIGRSYNIAEARNFAFGFSYCRINLLKNSTYKNSRLLRNLKFMPTILNYMIPDPRAFDGITFGVSLRNLGPNVSFIKKSQSDPLPQSIHIGLSYTPLKTDIATFKIGYEFERDLVSSYPDMDWDGDGKIGGYDRGGHEAFKNADYNKRGQQETAHTGTWYRAILTSWVSHWLLGGDIDKPGKNNIPDGIIGGYTFDDSNNIIPTDVEWGEPSYGKYNDAGLLEVGTGSARTFKDEWEYTTHHFGLEITFLGIIGYRIGKLRFIAGGSNTKSWGYFIGPDFLRYNYAELHEVGERYIENIQVFHTIEFNFTENFKTLLGNVFR